MAGGKTAEAEWEQLGPDSRAILQAYTDGVNAYLKDHDRTAASLEYAVLGLLSPDYRIQPWTPVNSLTWGKAMAWDLRGNMDEEIARAVLLKTLTPEQVDSLYPPYPSDHPVIVNKIGEGAGSASLPTPGLQAAIPNMSFDTVARNVSLLDGLLGKLGDGIGSNSWVISGNLTTTGMPILANDPHLGIQMPSIWYQVDLHCQPKSDACPFEVAGFSFAGVPGVVIGHNDRVAWGFTNVGPDVMDLFIEKVNPENPNQYEVNGKWVDFETRSETINVVGGDPVPVTVRLTRHGPVISDSFGPLKDKGDPKDKKFVPFKEQAGIPLPENYVVSLAWTALNPSTPFEAIWGFDRAGNWEEFRKAASNFHVPAQNLVYADVDGNIGYQMPGDIPIRASGDGRYPVPGWTDEYAWTGFIPFDELPYTFNPAEGYIVTANNQVPPIRLFPPDHSGLGLRLSRQPHRPNDHHRACKDRHRLYPEDAGRYLRCKRSGVRPPHPGLAAGCQMEGCRFAAQGLGFPCHPRIPTPRLCSKPSSGRWSAIRSMMNFRRTTGRMAAPGGIRSCAHWLLIRRMPGGTISPPLQ